MSDAVLDEEDSSGQLIPLPSLLRLLTYHCFRPHQTTHEYGSLQDVRCSTR